MWGSTVRAHMCAVSSWLAWGAGGRLHTGLATICRGHSALLPLPSVRAVALPAACDFAALPRVAAFALGACASVAFSGMTAGTIEERVGTPSCEHRAVVMAVGTHLSDLRCCRLCVWPPSLCCLPGLLEPLNARLVLLLGVWRLANACARLVHSMVNVKRSCSSLLCRLCTCGRPGSMDGMQGDQGRGRYVAMPTTAPKPAGCATEMRRGHGWRSLFVIVRIVVFVGNQLAKRTSGERCRGGAGTTHCTYSTSALPNKSLSTGWA